MELHLLILIGLLLIPATLAACAMDLLRAAIALLICSLGLSLMMFNQGAPLAGSFELSVGAGLITILFNAISFTRLIAEEERWERTKDHYKRFALLPALVIIIGFLLFRSREFWASGVSIVKQTDPGVVGEILWRWRGLDLIGQIIVLLVGVYGIAVLFGRGKPNA